jgi:hypothetical protein
MMTDKKTPSEILQHIDRVLMNLDDKYDKDEGQNGQQLDDLMTGLGEWSHMADIMLNSNEPALLAIRAIIYGLEGEQWNDGQVLRCCWLIMSAFGHASDFPENYDWDSL